MWGGGGKGCREERGGHPYPHPPCPVKNNDLSHFMFLGFSNSVLDHFDGSLCLELVSTNCSHVQFLNNFVCLTKVCGCERHLYLCDFW